MLKVTTSFSAPYLFEAGRPISKMLPLLPLIIYIYQGGGDELCSKPPPGNEDGAGVASMLGAGGGGMAGQEHHHRIARWLQLSGQNSNAIAAYRMAMARSSPEYKRNKGLAVDYANLLVTEAVSQQ